MIGIVRKYANELAPIVRSVEIQGGAMLPSELLAFAALCRDREVDAVIESGRKGGYSTEVLCRTLDVPIHSIERKVVAERDAALRQEFGDRLELLHGDGKQHVPRIAERYRRPAVLLDGPKNTGAMPLVREMLPNSVFVGVHDVCPLSSGDTSQANPGRGMAAAFPGAWFTDDDAFVKEYGWLDADWITTGGYKCAKVTHYKYGHGEFIKVCCVLGILPGGRWETSHADA